MSNILNFPSSNDNAMYADEELEVLLVRMAKHLDQALTVIENNLPNVKTTESRRFLVKAIDGVFENVGN